MEKITVKFLDYEIVNTGNGDGWVLLKPNTSAKNLWECHLGNYSTLEDAQRDAILQFMIARPAKFHATILYRMHGMSGQYHEYFLFERAVADAGLMMPSEITPSYDDGNFSVLFNGLALTDSINVRDI